MENTPEAAPQGTEAAPQTAPTEPAKSEAPEINAEQVAKYFGTDAETLGKFQKFVEANGKFDSAFSKMKTDISNPTKAAEKPTEPQVEEKKEEPTSHIQGQPVDSPKKMGLTNDEIAAQYYFEKLSREDKYASIAKEIANGDVLTEMSKLGIQFKYPDGSWDKDRINDYLDLRAKTVPAKPTSSEPNASAAPTVEYITVGDKIDNIDQAYQVLMQKNHPKMEMAKEYIRNHYSAKSGNK